MTPTSLAGLRVFERGENWILHFALKLSQSSDFSERGLAVLKGLT